MTKLYTFVCVFLTCCNHHGVAPCVTVVWHTFWLSTIWLTRIGFISTFGFKITFGFETTFFGFTGSAYDSIDDYDRDANLLSDLDSSFGFSGFCFCLGSVYFFDSGFCLSLSVFFYAIFSVASGGDGVAYFDSFSFGFLSVFEGTDAFLGIGLDFTSN